MNTILVVDDNDVLRTIMKMMLREFNVLEAVNGNEAVKIYFENKPDLVLMDILMPDKNGIEATEEIMKEDSSAIIIGLTAYSSRAHEMFDVGAKEILIKPLKRNDLINKVKEYLI